MTPLFTWKVAKNNPHDISGITYDPEDYLYYKLSGIYYPQPGTKMRVAHTHYCITIKDLSKVEDKDSQILDEGFDDGKTLADTLNALEGVSDTDYNGHFGNVIYLDIEGKYDTPELKLMIHKTIEEFTNG